LIGYLVAPSKLYIRFSVRTNYIEIRFRLEFTVRGNYCVLDKLNSFITIQNDDFITITFARWQHYTLTYCWDASIVTYLLQATPTCVIT